MKKLLFLGGVGLGAFAFYRYFKYQVDMALNYDYKIKKFKVLDYNNSEIKTSISIEIKNNSSFEILITEYDFKLFFKGINFANTQTTTPFLVLPESSFTLETIGVINIKESKISVLPFIKDVFERKKINIGVSGFVKVKFLGIKHTVIFNKEQFEYSSDLIREIGLDKKVSDFRKKNPAIAKFLGIK